jgi:hypothetical protein
MKLIDGIEIKPPYDNIKTHKNWIELYSNIKNTCNEIKLKRLGI